MSYHERSANLARRSVAAVAAAKAKPDWLASNKAIDLWSLAVCSFCLSVLCHSIGNMPDVRTASTNLAPQASTSSARTNSNFALKLFTLTTPRPQIESEE